MHEFIERLHPNDRVLLVGDTRQHESIEAGRIFAQLLDAGMKTVKLEEIVRQKDPELKQIDNACTLIPTQNKLLRLPTASSLQSTQGLSYFPGRRNLTIAFRCSRMIFVQNELHAVLLC
jgi:hypothetical protein